MNAELRTQYHALIAKICGIEAHSALALPKMIEQVTDDRLREALNDHLQETRTQRVRMEQVLHKHGGIEPASTAAFEKMLEEAEAEMTEITDADVRDAFIIAAAVNMEHSEIALYETVRAWSEQLEEEDDQTVFDEILKQEETAAQKLMGIAEGGIWSTGVVAHAAHAVGSSASM